MLAARVFSQIPITCGARGLWIAQGNTVLTERTLAQICRPAPQAQNCPIPRGLAPAGRQGRNGAFSIGSIGFVRCTGRRSVCK